MTIDPYEQELDFIRRYRKLQNFLKVRLPEKTYKVISHKSLPEHTINTLGCNMTMQDHIFAGSVIKELIRHACATAKIIPLKESLDKTRSNLERLMLRESRAAELTIYF